MYMQRILQELTTMWVENPMRIDFNAIANEKIGGFDYKESVIDPKHISARRNALVALKWMCIDKNIEHPDYDKEVDIIEKTYTSKEDAAVIKEFDKMALRDSYKQQV